MKSDLEIQKDVMEELKWEPYLRASEIGVAVKNGVVALSGIVDAYSKKISAEKAAKRVAGVKAVAEDIMIEFSPGSLRTDAEIAESVLTALKWNSAVEQEKVKIKVEDGNVRLEGEVEWEFQRDLVKNTIENISGVRSVLNLITVTPKPSAANLLKSITAAFQRSAMIDANNIKAEVDKNEVTLFGTVSSFAEKEEAERVAWAAPGIMSVNNKIVIELPEYAFDV